MKKAAIRLLLLPTFFSLLAGCDGGFARALTPASGSFQGLRHRDPVAILKAADSVIAQRRPDLAEVKAQEMSASAFAFFRGSAPLFYADARSESRLATSLAIPLQGDFHLENLGTYRNGSGQVAYDLNDFDEAFTGPYTWEVARCAVSIRLAAEEHAALSQEDGSELVDVFLRETYRQLQHLVQHPQALSRPLQAADLAGPAREAVLKAEKQGRPEFLQKLAPQERFKLGKKVRAVDPSVTREIEGAVATYAVGRPEAEGFYRVKDVAERVAGVASLGRYRYMVLIEGPTLSSQDDQVLELKEALPSAGGMGGVPDEAVRVRDAYRYFLLDPDPRLGIMRYRGQGMLVRELQPAKGGVELAELKGKGEFKAFLEVAAKVAARTMARSGQGGRILLESKSEDAFAGRLGGFAAEYLAQVKVDYKAFRAAR